MSGSIEIKPIGIIHSNYKKKEDIPIQPRFSKSIGEIEVFKEFEDGLKDIEGFSHITVLFHFHKSKKELLHGKPFLDKEIHGVFAIRHPDRPNHIGISTLKLIRRKDNILEVSGLDILDGTPLIDIKPYVPLFDKIKNVKIGWLGDKI